MSGTKLTHTQAVNRLKDIQQDLERLQGKANKTTEELAEVPKLMTEFRSVNNHRLDIEHAEALAEVRSALDTSAEDEAPAASGVRFEAGNVAAGDDSTPGERFRSVQVGSMGKFKNPWDLNQMRTFGRAQDSVDDELRQRSYDAIERMPKANDAVREAATKLVETGNRDLSELALGTTSPEYMRAYERLVREKGQVASLDGAEREAYTRAMSLTSTAGGFLIPMQLDSSVILTANGSSNPIRRIARVVQGTSDVWRGISSAGVTGSWDPEATEVSDDSPTFAQPSIPVYKYQMFVPISTEALQDEANVGAEVARMIAFEKDRAESEAFVTGTGSGQPEGIVTALVGSSSVIPSATADTFAVGDVYGLDSDLPARYAENASWVGNRATFNLTRRFDTSGGSSLWAQLGDGLPQSLLGRPAYASEAMDKSVTATQDNYMLIFGDFTNYVIVDRAGTTISYVPHLFGANRRPTGQCGWLAYHRGGAGSVNDAAFRMLNVT